MPRAIAPGPSSSILIDPSEGERASRTWAGHWPISGCRTQLTLSHAVPTFSLRRRKARDPRDDDDRQKRDEMRSRCTCCAQRGAARITTETVRTEKRQALANLQLTAFSARKKRHPCRWDLRESDWEVACCQNCELGERVLHRSQVRRDRARLVSEPIGWDIEWSTVASRRATPQLCCLLLPVCWVRVRWKAKEQRETVIACVPSDARRL